MCCDLWGKKLNATKTRSMIVSRSRIIHPESTPLTAWNCMDGTARKDSPDLVIFGVMLR